MYTDSDGYLAELLFFSQGLFQIFGGFLASAGPILAAAAPYVLAAIAVVLVIIIIAEVIETIDENTEIEDDQTNGVEKENDTPRIEYPGDDPSKSPGEGWEWKGKGNPESGEGCWFNKETGESFHPDLNHNDPIGPHWDYRNSNGEWYRIYYDHIGGK
ncbi:MAG: polymorphic toxin type 37 domain-containing protein [Candidatus Izemoplasmatales bacterium]|jgi:hypothetical protein|nr:polymorphic toxin type 37 domain-containing protein [Candidatus Izemoplasmatales bacterium]